MSSALGSWAPSVASCGSVLLSGLVFGCDTDPAPKPVPRIEVVGMEPPVRSRIEPSASRTPYFVSPSAWYLSILTAVLLIESL